MAHYAELDDNNIVLHVIVVRTQDTLDENGNESETVANAFLYTNGITGRFIRTSYNTYGGNHTLGGTPFRKNYAGIEFTYDLFRDAFIPIKPEDDPNNPDRYKLNEETCLWEDTLEKPVNIGVRRI
jgi:hypothetical protein